MTYYAYFDGLQPVVKQIKRRMPIGKMPLEQFGETESQALNKLLHAAYAEERRLLNEHATANLRWLNVVDLLKPKETR